MGKEGEKHGSKERDRGHRGGNIEGSASHRRGERNVPVGPAGRDAGSPGPGRRLLSEGEKQAGGIAQEPSGPGDEGGGALAVRRPPWPLSSSQRNFSSMLTTGRRGRKHEGRRRVWG